MLAEPLGPAVIGLTGAVLVLVVGVALLARRSAGLRRRLDGLTRGEDGRSLESILSSNLERVQGLVRDVERLGSRSAIQEIELRRAFQRVAVVRFNPFEDTGGNQSFAIALLDANGDGVVISSLHARGSTRVYAKTVSAGRAEGAASTEEAQALRIAMERSVGKPG